MSLFESTERLFRPKRFLYIFFTKSYTWDLVVRYIKYRNVKNRSLSCKGCTRRSLVRHASKNRQTMQPLLSQFRRHAETYFSISPETMAAMPPRLTLHKKGERKTNASCWASNFFPCPKRLSVTSIIDFAVCRVSSSVFPVEYTGYKSRETQRAAC